MAKKTKKCPVSGCSWRGSYENFQKHYYRVHYKPKKAKADSRKSWTKPKRPGGKR